jgi:hypothetical protein
MIGNGEKMRMEGGVRTGVGGRDQGAKFRVLEL